MEGAIGTKGQDLAVFTSRVYYVILDWVSGWHIFRAIPGAYRIVDQHRADDFLPMSALQYDTIAEIERSPCRETNYVHLRVAEISVSTEHVY